MAIGNASRAGSTRASARGSPVLRNTRAAVRTTDSSAVCLKVARITRATSGKPRAAAIVARVASSSSPYGTPEGHAVSHARQPRHRSRCVLASGSVMEISPSSIRLINTRRPRGLSFSSSRLTYVGHACKQNPQCTHRSKPAAACASGVSGMAQAGRLAMVWEAIVMVRGRAPGVQQCPCSELLPDRNAREAAVIVHRWRFVQRLATTSVATVRRWRGAARDGASGAALRVRMVAYRQHEQHHAWAR